jgi:hypothetical protein
MMPALVPAGTSLGRRAWSSTWATVASYASNAGCMLHGVTRREVIFGARPAGGSTRADLTTKT